MLIKNIRAPYSGETMKNYIAYDIEANEAEIVLLNRELLPSCFRILIKRFTSKKNVTR